MCTTPMATIGLLMAVFSVPTVMVLLVVWWVLGKRIRPGWGLLPPAMFIGGLALVYLGQ